MIKKCLYTAALLTILLDMPGSARSFEIGKLLENFSLQDLNGDIHTLDRYKGKILIIFFLGHN